MSKTGVIYVRVSTAEQAGPGHHSLQAQEKLCQQYAQAHAIQIVEVLRDEGYSGRNSKRPGLERLTEYTSSRPPVRINRILVQDTSRMSRDVTEYLLFRRQLQKRGIDLIAVAQPNIDSSPEGRLIDTIMAGINQYQSEEKGRRVAIALRKKFEDGVWPGWAPLGYRHVEKNGRRIIVPDPDSFPLVGLAFAKYSSGRYAQHQLCRLLATKGLRNRYGRPITRSSMNDLLANPFYFGLMRWNGREKIGTHEPACDRVTWEQCQQVTAGHNRFATRARKHQFLLSGLTECAACKKPHTRSVVSGKNKRYYHCNSRSKCGQPYIPEEELEEQVEKLIQKIRLTDNFIDRVVNKVRDYYTENKAVVDKEKSQLMRRQKLLDHKRTLVEDKLLSGVLSDGAFERHVPKINAELDSINLRLVQLEDGNQLNADALQKLLLFARDIPKGYKNAPFRLKRHYVEFFFQKLIVKDKRIIGFEMTEFFAVLLDKHQFDPAFLGSRGRTLFEQWQVFIKEKLLNKTGIRYSHLSWLLHALERARS